MRKLIILQGVPGSGKSTIARSWQAEDPARRVIVCKDSFRLGRGVYYFVQDQEGYIEDLEAAAIEISLNYGYDTMVDATNLEWTRINHVLGAAKNKYSEAELWLIHAAEKDCLKRSLNKDRDHSVPQSVIKGLYKKYLAWCEKEGIEPQVSGITKTKIS
jgi:predicted kinase